jgi:hypothetical protein
MVERLRFETKPNLKGDAFILQGSMRDFVESLPSQLYAQAIEVELSSGNNVVPHGFNSVPNGYFRVYQNSVSNIYDYQKPDRNNLYLNSSAATTIKIVVV